MEIITAILIVTVIGFIIGVLLIVASKAFAVPVNEKAEQITSELPGANCGACGFSGCSGYAKAIAENKAELGLCPIGGQAVAEKIGEILNIKVSSVEKQAAFVMCSGCNNISPKKMIYQGIKTCQAANQFFGGDSSCNYGCLGYGDCLNACDFEAIHICNGVAVVNQNNCVACKKCINTCPKNLIELVPIKKQAIVVCSNYDKGAETRKVCTDGCIGCMRCSKVCPNDAITIKNFKAHIDPTKCDGCNACVEECKTKCIKIINS